jgi:hypothetical protein
MEEAFGTVLIAICVVAIVAAAFSFRGSGAIYKGLGRTGGLSMDGDEAPRGPVASSAAAQSAEAREEIRQMLEAKSARREARGQAALDIDAEVEKLTAPQRTPRDAALVDEVRQLVVARNERRMRQGKPPLDIEEEVERQLRELGT